MHAESLDRLPLPRTTPVAELQRHLGRLRWQLGFERLLAAALRGAIASALALIALSVGLWLSGADDLRVQWLGAAPLMAAVILAIVRWPSRRDTALVADRRLALDDRLTTSVDLVAHRYGRFDLLQISDTVRRLASSPRVWLALTARTRAVAALAVIALAMAMAALVVLPTLPRPRSTPVSRSDVASAASSDDLADRVLPPDPLVDDQPLTTAQRSQPASTAPAAAELASRVQQEQAERTALDKLAQGLSNVSAGQAAADAIQQGDFATAHDQIQSLGDEADQLTDAAKKQLARGLQQAAAATTQTDRALADREQQAAQALSRATYPEQRQALGALAEQVQRSGARSVPTDQLQRDLGQLQQQQQQPIQRSQQQSQQRATTAVGARGQQPSRGAESTSDPTDAQPGGPQNTPASGGLSDSGNGTPRQGGAGIGDGASPDPFSRQPTRLDTAGQQVQVPTRLGTGPGVRPPDGTEDQSTADAAIGGKSVAELPQAQQTGQVNPEQNLVPGEQRPVVRGYFR